MDKNSLDLLIESDIKFKSFYKQLTSEDKSLFPFFVLYMTNKIDADTYRRVFMEVKKDDYKKRE